MYSVKAMVPKPGKADKEVEVEYKTVADAK